MDYVLLMRQAGEGCDYTIGCGYKWQRFSAPNLDGATVMAQVIVRDHGWRGERVAKAFLIQADESVDIGQILDAEDARAKLEDEKAKASQKEQADRDLYESLKNKFGD